MDYSSMKATKSGKKKLDIDFSISKRNSKKVGRAMKKSSIAWLLVLVVLIVGFAGGFFANKLIFSKDVYAMTTYASGEADIYIGPDEETKTYTEMGVKCIAFGKDYSKECTVTYYYRNDQTEKEVKVDKVDENIPGIYYAIYKTPAKKYASVKLIRNIIVFGEED